MIYVKIIYILVVFLINDCDNEFVCPKITEITDCGENGLNGYSTYRLSLIVKNPNVKNIYAIYGDDEIILNQ